MTVHGPDNNNNNDDDDDDDKNKGIAIRELHVTFVNIQDKR